jgi:hypothetical protein
MLVSLRREYGQLITSGGQLLLLFIGAKIGTREGWLYCLPLIAVCSLFAWRSALHRLRAIRDTPTSKIASAAQGYVELIGRGMQFSETPLLSPLRSLPCLWYRYKIEEQDGKNRRTVASGESADSFILRDASGECVIDPELAEINTIYHDHWSVGDMHYTEWKLLKNDQIYVLGEFRTRSGAVEFNSNAELNELLAEWKQDMPALHKRFDLNNDGELDMTEWMLARKAAQREVAKKMREAQAQPDLHIINQPPDGKLYLISNLTPEDLSRRYLYWSWAHAAIFFIAMAATGWLLQANVLIR